MTDEIAITIANNIARTKYGEALNSAADELTEEAIKHVKKHAILLSEVPENIRPYLEGGAVRSNATLISNKVEENLRGETKVTRKHGQLNFYNNRVAVPLGIRYLYLRKPSRVENGILGEWEDTDEGFSPELSDALVLALRVSSNYSSLRNVTYYTLRKYRFIEKLIEKYPEIEQFIPKDEQIEEEKKKTDYGPTPDLNNNILAVIGEDSYEKVSTKDRRGSKSIARPVGEEFDFSDKVRLRVEAESECVGCYFSHGDDKCCSAGGEDPDRICGLCTARPDPVVFARIEKKEE